MRHYVFTVLVAVTFGCTAWGQSYQTQTIVLSPERSDTCWTDSSYENGTNGGFKDEQLQVGRWRHTSSSYLKFDVSDLPKVRSAKLRLFCLGDGEFRRGEVVPVSMNLSYLTTPWGPTTGVDNPPGYQTVPETLLPPAAGQWYEVNITDLYEGWNSGRVENNGLVLSPVSPGGTSSTPLFNIFCSSRCSSEARRPQLVLETNDLVTPAAMTARARSSGGRGGGGLSAWMTDWSRFDFTKAQSLFTLVSPLVVVGMILLGVFGVRARHS